MLSPVRIIDIELSKPLPVIENLDGYIAVQALVRWNGSPLGWTRVPIVNGALPIDRLRSQIVQEFHWNLLLAVFTNAIRAGMVGRPIEDLLRLTPAATNARLPTVSVAICTRDRPHDLAQCLDAVDRLNAPVLEVLVIDNAPATEETKALVAARAPTARRALRYVREPRPGLDWARNRAIVEARGEIIAFTDDDTMVDAGWANAIAQVFGENPEVMAVTGLVVPAELETDAQALFELNGGFGRGFRRKWLHFPNGKMKWWDLGTGQLGTGANMAFRRSVFDRIGHFDPALDVGTPTQGAGDLEMFFRVLKSGVPLVYEPKAIVRHRHRRELAQLRGQLRNNGSVYAAFVRSSIAYPEMRLAFFRIGRAWFWNGHVLPWFKSLFYPSRFPRELRTAQIAGSVAGLRTYSRSRRAAQEIARKWSDQPGFSDQAQALENESEPKTGIAVREVDLGAIAPLTDVGGYARTRTFVSWRNTVIGTVDIANREHPIGVDRLSREISDLLGARLLTLEATDGLEQSAEGETWQKSAVAIHDYLRDPGPKASSGSRRDQPALPETVPVSIVVATFDRPNDLRECLASLSAQASSRPIEIVVVDNHPSSGVTGPVVERFPHIKLVTETRQGVAYARNAGIAACTGDIIVTVDDDVVVPKHWLEKLLPPFARPDVRAVTGNVLPFELETVAQQTFEGFGSGGLGRGYYRFEVGPDWFERSWRHAVPTWLLGGTANSAYRADVFSDPRIGLMDEALGPGMPSGVGEDIYLFYKVLKSGGTICYEPAAHLWHKHRRDIAALRRQLYGYSKGLTSYHLTTLMKDGDRRALAALLLHLPIYRLKQLWHWLRGRSDYPLSLIWLEIWGNLAGPWALWRSRQRVARQGPSTPVMPRTNRVVTAQTDEAVSRADTTQVRAI